MPTQSEALESVHRSLAALPPGRWLLAVSGGRDSMVLLDAMSQVRRGEIAGVASFDHGTGPAATRALRLVERTALGLELPMMTGQHRGHTVAGDEASWRTARWRFLNSWATELRATVVTAHTRDDQIETVLLRLLRGSGLRGLAAMRAPQSAIARPLLDVPRDTVAAYADARAVHWIEDPSNASLRFARNRVRHELLPALERASPGFGAWCWSLGERAAEWRANVAALVDDELRPVLVDAQRVAVSAEAMTRWSGDEAAMLWVELASRAGVAMDRRGIARVVAWAPTAQPGGEIPLSGGARVRRTHNTFVVQALY